jgi:hypothetical protein
VKDRQPNLSHVIALIAVWRNRPRGEVLEAALAKLLGQYEDAAGFDDGATA